MGNSKSKADTIETPTIAALHAQYIQENEECYKHISRTYDLFSRNETEKLDFIKTDKLIRHLLLQLGMLTYLSRFMSEEDHTLNWDIVANLGRCAISQKGLYNKQDFMDAALVWLYLLDFVREADTIDIIEHNKKQHHEEHNKYQSALKSYYENYRDQMTLYKEAAANQRAEIKKQQLAAIDARREIFDIADVSQPDIGQQNTGTEAHLDVYDFYKDIIVANTDSDKLQNSICYKADARAGGCPLSFGSPMPFTRTYRQRARLENMQNEARIRVQKYRGEEGQ